MNTKVRFVRCPRCRLVLPELAELPLYKCGGCATVLQAKNRKNDTKATEPCSRDTDPTQKNDLDHVSDDRKDSSLNQQATIPSTEESALTKSRNKDHNGFSDCRKERRVSNCAEIPISIELYCDENADSSPEAQAHGEPDDDKHPLDQYDKRDQSEFEGYTGEQSRDLNSTEPNRLENESSLPLAGALKEEDESKDPLEQNNGMGENEFVNCSSEWTGNMKISKEAYSSSDLTCNEIEELSQAAGSDAEMAENLKSRFIFKSSSPENLLDSRLKESCINAHRSVDESGLSKSLTSLSIEKMKQAENGILPCFERVSSVDTLQNVPLVNSSSELGVAHRERYKSPTARSYYAYDGSGSSCNEIDHKVPTRNFHFSRRNFKDKDFIGTRKLPKREESDKHLSGATFYSRGSHAGPSSYGHHELQHKSSHHSPDKPEYCESDKAELLRIVSELQGQLKRTHISRETINGRILSRVDKKEKQFPSYHGRLAPEREIYGGRCSRGKVCSPRCKFSRMAFSGEAMHCRHQVGCSCLQDCPREWHYSAQLPPHAICCNEGYHMAHAGHNCSGPHHSEFSSWSRDTKSDDQWKRLNLRDKHQVVKRHFRPMAGGSPIIACYRCFELLQVPADFLLFGRRFHRLRCSACSEVLKFSIQNKIHLVRYIPDAVAPPPSEVDDHADATKRRNLNAEAVSCSEDYEQSFCKSGSTEGDPSSLTPFNARERTSNDIEMSSASSFEPMEEKIKKFIFGECQNKYKNPVETIDHAEPSTKMSKREKSSSEIEEIRPGRTSPLHRLMGYSSPSKVIYR
ncbi:hypothetical protein LguiB_003464 [Lonicera macranthoides]